MERNLKWEFRDFRIQLIIELIDNFFCNHLVFYRKCDEPLLSAWLEPKFDFKFPHLPFINLLIEDFPEARLNPILDIILIKI